MNPEILHESTNTGMRNNLPPNFVFWKCLIRFLKPKWCHLSLVPSCRPDVSSVGMVSIPIQPQHSTDLLSEDARSAAQRMPCRPLNHYLYRYSHTVFSRYENINLYGKRVRFGRCSSIWFSRFFGHFPIYTNITLRKGNLTS